MDFEEVYNLALAIRDDQVSSGDYATLLEAYDKMQETNKLYPVNEIESQRLWKMASLMWNCGRAYERLYAYENNLIQ